MSRLLWLPDVLRDAGCDVYVLPGAETRGRDDIDVNGVVWHHTATGLNWQDGHVAALLRDGRRDLAGPLSQVGLERDGTWVLIALGRCNHNGYGLWGNDSIGIEMYNAGNGQDPWPAAQIESADRGTRAILAHLGLDAAGHLKAHRETDPTRKPDPVGVDMNAARARVAQPKDDDMTNEQATQLANTAYAVDKLLLPAVGRIEVHLATAAGKAPSKETLSKLTAEDLAAIADAVNDEAAARLGK